MNSYGHYAVDNAVPPYAGEDMLAGTVVEIDDDGLIVPRDEGVPLGVLAYDVQKDCTVTIATDGIVVTRVKGAANVGDWLKAESDGTVSTAGTGPVIGQARVPCIMRGAGIWTQVSVHLQMLPEAPAAGGGGGEP